MSYVTNYGGGETAASLGAVLKKVGNVVPLWRAAGRLLKAPGYDVKSAATFAVAGYAVVGTLLLLAMVAGISSWFGKNWNSGMVGGGQWLGAQHDIQRSDVYGDKKRSTAISPFLGSGVGPEFVEQPNYILGNENMQRTALAKFNRLKMSGAAVSTWPVFWAAYKADNSDDLDSSMYDFGDGMIDSKKFMSASRGN